MDRGSRTTGTTGTAAGRARLHPAPGAPGGRLGLAFVGLAVGVATTAGVALPGTAGGSRANGRPPGSRFLLRSDEEPGFVVLGKPTSERTVQAFLRTFHVGTARRKELTRLLEGARFRGATEELLGGPQNGQGASEVIELGDPGRARGVAAVLSALTRSNERGAHLAPFTVTGVPGARGTVARGTTVAFANAYWTAGACVLTSSILLPDGGRQSPGALSAPIVAGIRSQAHRIRKACP